jgi:hypothetical protein
LVINGDGRGDLIFSSITVGFWNIVKNLISKQVNLDTSIYLLRTRWKKRWNSAVSKWIGTSGALVSALASKTAVF